MIAVVVTLVAAVGIVTAAPPANAAPLSAHLLNRLSYQCLDVLGFNSSDGATIGQWSCNGASNQNWYVQPYDDASGNSRIVSQFSGKCMDVIGFNYSPGAKVAQWTCNGVSNQRFDAVRTVSTGSGNWVLTFHPVAAPHMCLDVLGANHEYGAPLGLWPCNGGYNQQFILEWNS